ncbi:MAG: MATE family efflux transporter, partial [Brasilonema sp.]
YVSYGFIDAVGLRVAQAYGANKTEQISRITCQGLWLAACLSFAAIVIFWNGDSLLSLFGQEEDNILLAKAYLRAIMWGFPAAAGYWVLKNVASALSHPQFIPVILLVGLLLDVSVGYVLIFGKLGFPALGLAGIGWVTALVYWFQFLAALCWIIFHPNFKDYKLFSCLNQFDKVLFGELCQIGWSIGFQLGAEMLLLAVTALLMGRLGTEILVAHEITIETTELAINASFGIVSATTTRVGITVGKQNPLDVKIAAFVGIALGSILSLMVAFVFLLFTDRIVGIYLDINKPENIIAVKEAISFFHLAAIFQFFYGIQVIAFGALLAIKDTRIPILINLLAFWGIGFSGSYLMGIILGWGGIGLWLGLILGPVITTVIFIWRFYLLVSSQFGSNEEEVWSEADGVIQ